jgi:glycerol-3-phosphate cytidylyltransferase-like family protein
MNMPNDGMAGQQGQGQQMMSSSDDPDENGEKKKPVILDEGRTRYTGRLKFFDEVKNFGFIIMDNDGGDIFVHFDDLSKANLPKEFLRTAKKGNIIRLSFCCLKYIGKHNKSRKAVDVILIP